MEEKIRKILADCSIPAVGFCDFETIKKHLLPCRAKERLPKGAKTVIVCLFPYKVEDAPPENISRYAAVPDYHKVCMEYLKRASLALSGEFNGATFEPFIDNSSIPEVAAAALAGLGVRGENRLLITERWGSFVFIGEIVTDLFVPSDGEIKKCIGCGKCRVACPKVDSCLSELSQKKGELDPREEEQLKNNKIVWGCDICAEVCPLNKNAEKTQIPEFIKGYRQRYEIGEDIKGRAYEWRGEKTVKRNAQTNKN